MASLDVLRLKAIDLANEAASRYTVSMVSREEFEALRKLVEDLADLSRRTALSHKDVLEKYLPEAVNTLGEKIVNLSTSHVDLANKVADLMNLWSKYTESVESRLDLLELRADNSM